MPLKVTQKQFVDAIENNELRLTNQEIANKLGISEAYFYQLRWRWRKKIANFAIEMAQRLAAEQVMNLRHNAKNGDTKAAAILLEMAESYIPQKKQRITMSGELNCGVIVLPEKVLEGSPVNLPAEKNEQK